MERRSSTRFSPSEIARMEKLVSDKKGEVLVDSFCQKLVEEFNRSAARVGSRALQATQPLASEPDALVSEIKASASEEKKIALDTSISNNEDALSPDLPKETTDKVPEFEDLQFEAKSSKDSAWYDVALFLAHRKTSLGEVEVRVRFVGYGAEEDEWVNVRKAVRQQSIPLESSECRSIVKGDLVLCFKESNDEALHFDAHIVDVQWKQHDIRGCRCLFTVEYDHDQSQEMVNLKRISRRPRYL
uniref:SAWADEE domain-containing protein n=1 Tax=Hordeum vulgare subsp. vulgare TaxID=112509 RepID=A0A8I6XEJ6_HORVV